ncbi:hypothetical protein CDV31_016981, partial [Fusarium ambrosium]
DILINETYRVDYRIGKGGFGLVFAGTDIRRNEGVAIKLIRDEEDRSMLEDEAMIYRALSGEVGIPRVLWYGHEEPKVRRCAAFGLLPHAEVLMGDAQIVSL